MYYSLSSKYRLHKEPSCVVLFDAGNTSRLQYLSPAYAALLTLCNGQRRQDQLLETMTEMFSLTADDAKGVLDKALRDFGDALQVSPEPVTSDIHYDPQEYFYEPVGKPNLQQLSAPIDLAWLVTERCHCSCAYCCIATLPAAPPPADELSFEQARRLAEDCVETGIQSIILHGGEPFLRSDLPDLVQYFLQHKVYISLSTKMRLSEKVVARLAEAGLGELQVSVDSLVPETCDELVGHAKYLDHVVYPNLELLQRFGIKARVNAVVTGVNLTEIPALITGLAERGVDRFLLSGYLRSPLRHDDRFFTDQAALVAMADEVTALADTLGVEVVLPPLQSPRDISLEKKGFTSCLGGRSGLVVGADGRVATCDRLLPFDEAIIGNVKTSTLQEIWESEQLRAMVYPDREAFAGTECESCRLIETCERRIRCYLRSLVINQRLFSPDYLCDVLPPPQIRHF